MANDVEIAPVAWADIDADIKNTIDDATNTIRYGKVRDTGESFLNTIFEWEIG